MESSPRDLLCYLGKGTAKCSNHLSQQVQYTVRLLLQEFILKEDAIKNTTKKDLYKGGVTIKPFRLGKARFFPNRAVMTKKLKPLVQAIISFLSSHLGSLISSVPGTCKQICSDSLSACSSKELYNQLGGGRERNSSQKNGCSCWLSWMTAWDLCTSLVLLKVTQGSYIPQTISCCGISYFCPKQVGHHA